MYKSFRPVLSLNDFAERRLTSLQRYGLSGWGSSSVSRASDRYAADAGSIPRCDKGCFSKNQLSVQTLMVSVHPPCAIACINICGHVTGPLVHIRVRWNMQTLTYAARTAGWVARLCRSWFSPDKATRISHGRTPNGTTQLSIYLSIYLSILVFGPWHSAFTSYSPVPHLGST